MEKSTDAKEMLLEAVHALVVGKDGLQTRIVDPKVLRLSALSGDDFPEKLRKRLNALKTSIGRRPSSLTAKGQYGESENARDAQVDAAEIFDLFKAITGID